MINILLSALAGFLTGISFDFSCLSFLVWFSLVPLLFSLSHSNLRRSLLQGFIFSLFYFGTSIFWIANVTKLGLFFILFYLSLYPLVFYFLAKFFFNKSKRIITYPCLWVICEFLRENIWTGFGWVNLGYSQYLNLNLIQIVDIFGVKFISFLIVMVNVLIWESILFLSKRQKSRANIKTIFSKVFFVIIILSSCFLYSTYKFKYRAFENKDFIIEISLIQPNVPQELKWDPQVSYQIVNKLRYLGKITKKGTLVIFPEAAWPFTIDLENVSQLREFIKDIERDILLGAATKEKEKFHNSALLLSEKGRLSFSYNKIKLVPFGEYVPLRKFLDFIEVINLIGDMAPGNTVTKFLYKGKSFSVLICFEDIFPLHVRKFALNRDFLVNITNDAWFKGEPEASQHLGIMVFRAVENNIPIIRSANTGISGWVSSFGKIEKLTKDQNELDFSGVGTFSVLLEKNRSFYNKYGDVFILFCFIILLIVYARRR